MVLRTLNYGRGQAFCMFLSYITVPHLNPLQRCRQILPFPEVSSTSICNLGTLFSPSLYPLCLHLLPIHWCLVFLKKCIHCGNKARYAQNSSTSIGEKQTATNVFLLIMGQKYSNQFGTCPHLGMLSLRPNSSRSFLLPLVYSVLFFYVFKETYLLI